MKSRFIDRYFVISIFSILSVLIIWWILFDVMKIRDASSFPGILKVVKTFFIKLTDPNPDQATLLVHMLSSLKVALLGYLLGAFIGIPLGIFMAWFEKMDWFFRPLFDLLRPIPGIAWIPLMLTLFGIGIFSKVAVIFMSALPACVVNAYSGIRQTKQVHLWVAQTFGAGNLETLFKVAIPTSLPFVMTGLRVSLAASWTALVAAELLSADSGLGYMIVSGRSLYRPDLSLVGMIGIGILGAILTWLLSRLEKKIVKGGRFS